MNNGNGKLWSCLSKARSHGMHSVLMDKVATKASADEGCEGGSASALSGPLFKVRSLKDFDEYPDDRRELIEVSRTH